MNAFVRSSQNETMIRCSLIHTTEDWYRKRNQPRMKLRQEKGERGRGKGQAARWSANIFKYSRQDG